MHRRQALTKTAAIVIAVIIVIAIIGGAWWYMSQPTPTPTETTPPAEKTTPAEGTTAPPTETVTRDVIRVAIGVDLDTVDPHGQTTTTVYNVMRHVYETLLWFDDEGNVIPWLAESWEVSEDGLEYTFHLRKGVKFHDGSELTAEVVKANIDRWLDPTVKVPTRSQLGPIDHAEVIDKYTIKIVLKKSFAPFLASLAEYLLITSKNIIDKFGNKTITEVVGTGPFVFKEWVKGSKIVLGRFDDYWGEKPKVRVIEWRIIPEAGTREAALLAGDVDVTFQPPPADIESLRNNPAVTVLTPVTNRVIFVALMPKGPLKNKLVRQALNYAIDRQAIVENVLFGLGVPADSVVPPHFFGYAKMTPYEYNPEKAKQLLAEAGYPNGFKLVLMHPTGRYLQDKQVAEAIQAYLSAIGIEVELKTMDWPSFVKELFKPLNEKIYDAVLIGWGPGVADAYYTLYPQFHSTCQLPHGLGLAYYNNSYIDELLDKSTVELNPDVRKELYKEIIAYLWDDAPWIFLYTQCSLLAFSSNLKGVWIHPDGEQFYFFYTYFTS